MALQFNNDTFEKEVLQSDIPVLVDFWATWCGPCRMLLPLVEEVAEQAQGFKVGKVNTDENQDLAYKYKVMTIPTLILFKDGKEVARNVGVITKEEIEEFVKNAIK